MAEKKANEAQQRAIDSTAKRIKALACAGSGKTFSLVGRVNRIIKDGSADISEIMCITFTVKAAQQLKHKIPGLQWCGTMHSIFYRLICEKDGNLSIIDDYTRKKIYEKIKEDIRLKCGAKKMDELISNYYKNLPPATDWKERQFVEHYLEFLKYNKYIDYDGIERRMLELVKLNNNEYRSRFRHLIIDEFQDTSKLEMEIINILDIENVFVVGDISQNLYSFRGTTIDNIRDFQADEEINMNISYRYTQQIADFDNKMMAKNDFGYINDVKSVSTGTEVLVLEEPDLEAVIEKVVKYSRAYKSVYILCRSNAEVAQMSRKFQEIGNIEVECPIDIKSSNSFHMLTSFLNFIINPDNELNIMLMLGAFNVSSINAIDLKRTQYMAKGMSLIDGIMQEYDNNEAIEDPEKRSDCRDGHVMKSILEIMASQQSLIKKIDAIYQMAEYASDYDQVIEANYQYITMKLVRQYLYESGDSVDRLYEYLCTINAQDIMDAQEKKVKCGTVHAFKGLEAELVFIPNFVNGRFPYAKGDFQEELRVAHVAFTRAIKKLIIWKPEDKHNVFLED